MLSVTHKPLTLNVVMLSVIILNVVVLSVIMLNVVMLSVVASLKENQSVGDDATRTHFLRTRSLL
jgi:hypothetical protein